MADAKFEKLDRCQTPLYGKPVVIACGFNPQAQARFKTLLELAGLSHVPVVWPNSAMASLPVGKLASVAGGTGQGEPSVLPRAVIVAGITSAQLHDLMGICRQTGMQPALWATLTPTSETWTLGQLLAELSRERAAMEARKRQASVTKQNKPS